MEKKEKVPEKYNEKLEKINKKIENLEKQVSNEKAKRPVMPFQVIIKPSTFDGGGVGVKADCLTRDLGL